MEKNINYKKIDFYEPKLINDHFQNYKQYNIPKAQLIIADIPYNLWVNAYASSTEWYIDWDNSKWESDKAWKQFFDTDKNFKISEFLHYASQILRPEPKENWKPWCVIVFCAFEQQFEIIEKAKEKWFLIVLIGLLIIKHLKYIQHKNQYHY